MPNLPAHISLAMEVSNRVPHATIDQHMGSFLLGSTSPDIRIMTKWERDQTHFAPLSVERVGTGVDGLFQAHPELADPSLVGQATVAFLCGYVTHLVADETWILDIYLPYFGNKSAGREQIEANIWDRALQLDMDKTAREGLGDMGQVRSYLEGSETDVEVEFIKDGTLREWRAWVSDFTTWEFTWERLRFATRRIYRDDPVATGIAESFLQTMPASLERVYETVSEATIAEYKEKTITESAHLIKEYLGVPESHRRSGTSQDGFSPDGPPRPGILTS